MSRRSAEPVEAARMAIVGAETVDGAQLREVLAGARVPGRQVDLFGSTHGETVLSEYAGEARLIQEPDPAEVLDHDVVFLCETGESSSRILAAARTGALVVDLAGCTEGRDDVPLVHMDVNAGSASPHSGIVAVPHGVSVILATTLAALRDRAGVRSATAVVLRPVSAFGEAGVEELRDQTVRLFNFTPVPTTTFGRQLAFNLLEHRSMDVPDVELDRRIAEEVRRVLAWPKSRLSLRLVTVPVFHGHALCVRIEPETPATLPEAQAAIAALPGIRGPAGAPVPTPLEAAENRIPVAAEVSEDGLGGFWVWLVSGQVGRFAAEHALRLVRGL